jgi:hypothetical protein
LDAIDESYPTAASQRDIVQVIEAATQVADHNYNRWQQGGGTPVTALLNDTGFDLVEPATA